jgi:hypothetical protein
MGVDFDTLNERFDALKRDGANVLVLGGASGPAGCHGLLGSDSETRRRLFVTAGRPSPPETDTDPDVYGHVDVDGVETRSAAAVQPSPSATAPSPTSEAYSRVARTDDLPTLADRIHEQLSRFDEADPAPAEIRLCFDSLDPFVDEVSPGALLRFLRVVTGRVDLSTALAHYHLSPAVDDGLRERLEPLFEATVERRLAGDGTQQRCDDLRTDWLPLRD